jgi:hypothetical protein
MLDWQLIHPAQLRAVWGRVKAGLEAMPPEDWIAEDVYHAIKSGQSALYLFQEAGQFAGFIVLRRQIAEFSGEVSCHIWLAYSVSHADAYLAAESFIKDAAKHMGASRITFSSPRKGWAKRYPLVSSTYEISL